MTGARTADEGVSFREEVLALLAQDLGESSLELVEFSRSGGGHSWETYLVEVANPVGVRQRFAIKRQPSVGMLGTYDVRREVDLLELAHTIGVPVPGVVAHRPGSPEGRGFYATEFMDGVVPTPGDLSVVVPDPEARRQIGLELAGVMARLHAHPVADVPPSVGDRLDDPGRTGEVAVEHWRRAYLAGSPIRMPVLDLAYAWLSHRAPNDVTGRQSFIHNDLHVGNFISDGSRVVAVLDWETAEISDPACDIAKFDLPTWRGATGPASGLVPLPDFLEEYARHGGVVPSEEALRFWRVFCLVKSATIMLTSSHRYVAGQHRDVRWGNLGFRMLTHMRILVDLLEQGEWGQP